MVSALNSAEEYTHKDIIQYTWIKVIAGNTQTVHRGLALGCGL